jgi:hypothetical protein
MRRPQKFRRAILLDRQSWAWREVKELWPLLETGACTPRELVELVGITEGDCRAMARLCSHRVTRDSVKFRAKVLQCLNQKFLATRSKKAKTALMETREAPEPTPAPNRDERGPRDVLRVGRCEVCQNGVPVRVDRRGRAVCRLCYPAAMLDADAG